MKKTKAQKTVQMMATAAVVAGVGVGTMGMSTALASDRAEHPKMNEAIERIASKLQVDEETVRSAMMEYRKEMEDEMQAKEAERLTQAVEDGVLTQEQVEMILVKRDELRMKIDDMKEALPPKTEEGRIAFHEAAKVELSNLKAWADEEGIDMKYLHPFGHERMHREARTKTGGMMIKRMN